jgi:hypothetical protein
MWINMRPAGSGTMDSRFAAPPPFLPGESIDERRSRGAFFLDMR